MTTNALEYHLEGFYKMYNSPHSRPQRFNIISAEEYKALKMLVPAETTALFDFLLTKVGLDPGVLAELSVTPARAASVNERFTELISDTWPRIRERIRFCLASINGILPSDGVTGNSMRAGMRRASKVHGLLKYHACCCKRGSKKELLLCFPIFKQFSSKLRAWRVVSPRLAAKEATGVTGRQPMKQLSVLRGALPEVRLTVSRKLLITTLQRTVTQDSARLFEKP